LTAGDALKRGTDESLTAAPPAMSSYVTFELIFTEFSSKTTVAEDFELDNRMNERGNSAE
jgi:hypothetical protein